MLRTAGAYISVVENIKMHLYLLQQKEQRDQENPREDLHRQFGRSFNQGRLVLMRNTVLVQLMLSRELNLP